MISRYLSFGAINATAAFLCGALLSLAVLPSAEYFIVKESGCKAIGLNMKQRLVVLLCGGLTFALCIDSSYFGFRAALPELLFCSALVFILLLISVVDAVCGVIPNMCMVMLSFVCVASLFVTLDNFISLSITERLIGALVVSAPLLIAALITGGVGGGDIKLFAVCGFLLGFMYILLAFVTASVAAAIFGVAYAKIRRVSVKTSKIPFGPFICAGALISYFYGSLIIDSYMSFFGI